MTENIHPDRAANRLLLAIPICVWAISWPVMKIGVAAIPPIWFGFLRYLIAALCFAAIVALKGRLAFPRRQDWALVLVSGALQMAAFSALTGLALTIVQPGQASVLAYSTPLWVAPVAAWRLGEPLSRRTLVGIAAGLIGIAVIAAPSVRARQLSELAGYAMLLGAAGGWAISILYVRAHRFGGTPFELAPWQMAVAALLLLPVAMLTEGRLQAVNVRGAFSLAYVGPFATALAYWAIVEAGRHFRASTVSMALLATPVLGIAISAATLSETVDAPLLAGMALIGGGVRLATTAPGPDIARGKEAVPLSLHGGK